MLFLNKCKRSWSLCGILATFTPFFVGKYTIYIYLYTRSRWNHERKMLFVEPHVYRLCVCVFWIKKQFSMMLLSEVYTRYTSNISPFNCYLQGENDDSPMDWRRTTLISPRGDESDDDIPGRDAEAGDMVPRCSKKATYQQLKYPIIIVEHRLSSIIIDIYKL